MNKASLVGALILCLCLLPPQTAALQREVPLCQGQTCYQTDPYATRCADYALLIASATMESAKQSGEMGRVMLWESLSCNTFWSTAMSDIYSCAIGTQIFTWDGAKLGGSESPGGSSPLSYADLDFAYSPQFPLPEREQQIWATGFGKLCVEVGYSGTVTGSLHT